MKEHIIDAEHALREMPDEQRKSAEEILLSLPADVPLPAFFVAENRRLGVAYPLSRGSKPCATAFQWGRDIPWSQVNVVVELDGSITINGGVDYVWSVATAAFAFAPAVGEEVVRDAAKAANPRAEALEALAAVAERLAPEDVATLAIDVQAIKNLAADAKISEAAVADGRG